MNKDHDTNSSCSLPRDENEWKKLLGNGETFRIMREKGTEAPWSSDLLYEKREGVYCCKACHTPLFHSSTKFDSGSGWPSFWEADSDEAIELRTDESHGMRRTEVLCRKCKSHLGHVFNDGPLPTGLRYCINGLTLDFILEQ